MIIHKYEEEYGGWCSKDMGERYGVGLLTCRSSFNEK